MNRLVTRVGLLTLGFAFIVAATVGCSASDGGSPGVGGKGGAVGSAGAGGGGGSGGAGGVSGGGGVPGSACNFSVFGSGRTIDSQTDVTTIVVLQRNGTLTSINGVPCTSTSVMPYHGMTCGETYACGDCSFTIVQDELGFWNFDISEAERQKPACVGYAPSYLYPYSPFSGGDCAGNLSAACSSCIAACSGQVDCCCSVGAHCSCGPACAP